MVRRPVLVVVTAWFLAVVFLGSVYAGSHCQEGEERIWLPWGPTAPPVLGEGGQAGDLHPVFYFRVTNLVESAQFTLGPAGGDSGQVICADEVCVYEPDFNIAFLVDSGLVHARVEVFDDPGPVSGTVPPSAKYAIVWMNTGANPGGLDAPGPLGAKFELKQGCS